MNQKLPYGKNVDKLEYIEQAINTLRKDYEQKEQKCSSVGDREGFEACADVSYLIDQVQGHIANAHKSKSQNKFDMVLADVSQSYDELTAHIKVNGRVDQK